MVARSFEFSFSHSGETDEWKIGGGGGGEGQDVGGAGVIFTYASGHCNGVASGVRRKDCTGNHPFGVRGSRPK